LKSKPCEQEDNACLSTHSQKPICQCVKNREGRCVLPGPGVMTALSKNLPCNLAKVDSEVNSFLQAVEITHYQTYLLLYEELKIRFCCNSQLQMYHPRFLSQFPLFTSVNLLSSYLQFANLVGFLVIKFFKMFTPDQFPSTKQVKFIKTTTVSTDTLIRRVW